MQLVLVCEKERDTSYHMISDAIQQIVVQGVDHEYRMGAVSLLALSNMNIEVTRGEFLSIIGPSGSGKTTLVKLMGGLLVPTSGHVKLNNRPPSDAQARKSIGWVSQEGALLPWRTVIDNVSLPLEVNNKDKLLINLDAETVVDAVGLADFMEYYPHQLSGGMKQRVALARSLVTDPDVLLMDEPLGSLDEITRMSMRYELLKIWEHTSKTAVMVTHSITEALSMSERVIVLSQSPGCVIGEILVDLPYPRDDTIEREPSFLDKVEQVKSLISLDESLKAR